MRAIVAVAAVAVVAIIAYLAWNSSRQDPEETPVATEEPSQPAASEPSTDPSIAPRETADAEPEPATAVETEPPSFDIVRISPEGGAVIAGRAEPGARVMVMEGDTVIAEVTADARGEWVVVAKQPIAPGSRQLSLTEVTVDGEIIESESVVILAIPKRQTDDNGADPAVEFTAVQEVLAVLMTRDAVGGSEVLQGPDGGVGLKGARGLTLDSIEYDDTGRFALGGRVAPGRPVMVYLDNSFVGSVRGGNDGKWRMVPDKAVEPGLHNLRVDLVDEDGAVLARLETPFARADFTLPLGRDSAVVVQPGNSLWRIARRTYGDGVQYVTIFEANRDQIGNPDLIYPGQIFMLPSVN